MIKMGKVERRMENGGRRREKEEQKMGNV